VNSGLAEISLQEKDTNAAIRFIEICLTNTPPGSQAAKAFAERLKSLQPGSP
jgi:hypothetical protein